jgi:hypothetical protein
MDRLHHPAFAAVLCYFLSVLALSLVAFHLCAVVRDDRIIDRLFALFLAAVFLSVFLLFQAGAYTFSTRTEDPPRTVFYRLKLVKSSPLPCVLYQKKQGGFWLPMENL